ncbi:Ribonuclease T2 precursor (RNase T2) [Exophiala dermatitidis]|nr:Ribonuclease T2 precursor (RNase T2) [Exophiala dermatitidis]
MWWFQQALRLPLISSLINLNLLSNSHDTTNTNTSSSIKTSINNHDTPTHSDQHPLQQPLQIQSQEHCPYPPLLSCPFPPPADGINTCCINHPSGHFLQTQFWDTSPALGAADSWTIHGLWPDLCTGGFDQFCGDATRRHDDIVSALEAAASREVTQTLLDYMRESWLALDGDDAHLWAHEWNKHGTCISTLEPVCYGGGDNGDEVGGVHKDSKAPLDVLDYFIQTTSLFRTLDTYSILADAGIIPSYTKTYTLSELEDAISSSSEYGHPVTFRCDRFGQLNEIWYHFAVLGPLRTNIGRNNTHTLNLQTSSSSPSFPFLNESIIRDTFIPTSPFDGAPLSNCPRSGIKYRPKSAHKNPPPHPYPGPSPTTSKTSPTATAHPFSGRGYLKVNVLKTPSSASEASSSSSTSSSVTAATTDQQSQGCLIRLGDWYTSGTCATFKAQPDVVDPGHAPLFSLSSSFSPCAINPATSKFECTKSTAIQSIFSSDPESPYTLSYRNSTTFYAAHSPHRFEKVGIYADSADGEREVELGIQWIPV